MNSYNYTMRSFLRLISFFSSCSWLRMNYWFRQCQQLWLLSVKCIVLILYSVLSIPTLYIMHTHFINNRRQLQQSIIKNMKTPKPQPTSYKDFIDQIGKAQALKTTNQSKLKQTPRMPTPNTPNTHNNIASVHTQSTCLWDKKSPSHSQRKLGTDASLDKKIRSYNVSQSESYNQSHNQSQNQSYNQSYNQSTQLENRSVKISKKDKQLSYHKFVTETTVTLTQIFKTPVPDLLNNRMSYIEYLQALKSLKMIYESYEPYPCDIVSELWSECISGQNVGNFIITVCAILGLYQCKQSQEDKYLKQKYQSLRYTRLELNKGSLNQSYKQNQLTFMPQISDRSRKLATSVSKSKSKSKKYEIHNSNTEHALTDRNNGSVMYYQKSKTSIMDESQNFNLNNIHSKSKLDRTGNKRSQILYQRAKQKSCQRRQNRSTNDIQFEKNQKQLTFKPIITKIKTKEKQTPKCSVRGEKNTISRMIRGRVQREVRKIINQKGVPYNQKVVDKMRKEKYEQIVTTGNFQSYEESLDSCQGGVSQGLSLLNSKSSTLQLKPEPAPVKTIPQSTEQDIVIDVYLTEDHKQKLIVRKGEDIEQLATAFIQKHGIGNEKKQQLIQMLQVSLNHALCPIDELVEQEDELASARTHYNKRQYCR